MKKTSLKRKPGSLKWSPLKKGAGPKRKSPDPETIQERKATAEKDELFYLSIWVKRRHNCQVCGDWLDNLLKKLFFDHLLEKSKYPQFRYVEDNIALVCGTCHACKTDGHPKTKHVLLIEEAKQKLL